MRSADDRLLAVELVGEQVRFLYGAGQGLSTPELLLTHVVVAVPDPIVSRLGDDFILLRGLR